MAPAASFGPNPRFNAFRALIVLTVGSSPTVSFTTRSVHFTSIPSIMPSRKVDLPGISKDNVRAAKPKPEEEGEDIAGDGASMRFGQFRIASSQIFYTSPTRLTAGIVNLRPIVPGHVLIVPRRVAPLLSDLTEEEYQDLWGSVRTIQGMLKSQYDSPGFNIAVQDGPAAGQSVPHVHVHILPRNDDDLDRNDEIYDRLEEWAPKADHHPSLQKLDVPEDDARRDRTVEEMKEEANLYRRRLLGNIASPN